MLQLCKQNDCWNVSISRGLTARTTEMCRRYDIKYTQVPTGSNGRNGQTVSQEIRRAVHVAAGGPGGTRLRTFCQRRQRRMAQNIESLLRSRKGQYSCPPPVSLSLSHLRKTSTFSRNKERGKFLQRKCNASSICYYIMPVRYITQDNSTFSYYHYYHYWLLKI